jgi:transaldolase
MPTNPLLDLHAAGQSLWLDYIDRAILHNGELARRVETEAITGMTSNPTIFEKALAQGTAYDAQLSEAAADHTAWELFELIETDDVRAACDIFRNVYDACDGADGFVSIEVSPGAANNAQATIDEAHRLWATVNRPNVMIKVPGTSAGEAALRRLIADGVNVNVTLLFAVEAHARIIDAYLAGLEDRVQAGRDVARIASVASFFVSRVDTEADKRLEKIGTPEARSLLGQAAVANAKLAYALFQDRFAGPRWAALAGVGARVQRPLWASTGTKNPAYSDVKYVEALIGPDTVNTLPPATLEAFRDHGRVARRVDTDVAGARATVAALSAAGVDLRSVTDQLLTEGVASFQKSFDTLIAGLEKKAASLGRTLVMR